MGTRKKPAMGGNKQQQAVSLARRMAGKKGAVVQLQTEVNTEEDWEKLLTKDGLIVVDVYSDWCGPCVGMVGNLKKCKLEIGGDSLHLAIAKSDEIEALKRFRNKSEPTWMFISGGGLISVIFGANAPKLIRMIETELKFEQMIQKGEQSRKSLPFDELMPEEIERRDLNEKIRLEEEKIESEKQLIFRNELRNRRFTIMQKHLINDIVVILFPHTVGADSCQLAVELEEIWNQIGVSVVDKVKMEITPEAYEEIFYRADNLPEELPKNLKIGPCLAILLQALPTPPAGILPPEEIEDIERLVCEAVYNEPVQPGKEFMTPSSNSILAQYYWQKPVIKEKSPTVVTLEDDVSEESEDAGPEVIESETSDVPGAYIPCTALSKCAAFVQFFPVRAEKIAVVDLTKLPPRMTIVFDPSKAEDCFAMAQEYEDEILGIGFFNKADPDEAILLARTPQQYAKLPQSGENKLVVIVAKRRSEPMLSFASLGPLYVSPDEKTGILESDKFFPPGVEINPVGNDGILIEEDIYISEDEDLDDEDEASEGTDDNEALAQSSSTSSSGSAALPAHLDDDKEGASNADEIEMDQKTESELPDGGQTPVTAINDTEN